MGDRLGTPDVVGIQLLLIYFLFIYYCCFYFYFCKCFMCVIISVLHYVLLLTLCFSKCVSPTMHSILCLFLYTAFTNFSLLVFGLFVKQQ